MTQPTGPIKNRNAIIFGFSPQAEIWNGRFAMIGFIGILLVEFFAHQGILHFWGIL
ncbi:chlorophyll a/b-binding protein [Lyngbya confervoides]|uniref:Chlorophyll a/b-binding protein n=1 Tax=Lyngbya confervoides BDU141951 TaxID=1574623 RepID=A0ABD4TAG0_9CYAN|nr:chlorophyll a/b-binding protein [Lyngbya confervoides]MCM1985348.1 chlorophyll a/b-binding protein [Lyngbya confervoides BDU141951]